MWSKTTHTLAKTLITCLLTLHFCIRRLVEETSVHNYYTAFLGCTKVVIVVSINVTRDSYQNK